jgi:uncharacterized protein (TIGR02996 family)
VKLGAEDQRFVDALTADPDDDAVRLVYADWLEERGDRRGEFLRVEAELTKTPEGSTKYAQLEDRLPALRRDIDPGWMASIAFRVDLVLVYYRLEGISVRSRLDALRWVRHITRCEVDEAKEMVNRVPCVLRKGLRREEAERFRDDVADFWSGKKRPAIRLSIRRAHARKGQPPMKLLTEPYLFQAERWPTSGRHILAQFDADTAVVYQAYRPDIGRFAVDHGFFGGGFSMERMSWIKPNFLWMMYRSGWGTKQDQEVTLAVRLKRPAFDAILAEAVHSTFVPEVYGSERDWQAAVARSSVRLQWDPDHDPSGAKLERRAIQVGMRGEALRRYSREWIVEIEDVSAFVAEQRSHAESRHYTQLLTPREDVYPVADPRVAAKLGIAS